jgi:hypothetical protein
VSARPEYIPWQQAVLEALGRWHPEAIEELRAKGLGLSEATLAETGACAALDVTLRRLRGFVSTGELVPHYGVGVFGWLAVPQDFWAAPEGEDALGSGYYSPSPGHRKPSYQLRVLKSELDALFKKRVSFSPSRISALVEALKQHDHELGPKRRELVSQLPQFRDYHITDDIWREAEKQAPLPRGRRPI